MTKGKKTPTVDRDLLDGAEWDKEYERQEALLFPEEAKHKFYPWDDAQCDAIFEATDAAISKRRAR